jgi:hypothetical protein
MTPTQGECLSQTSEPLLPVLERLDEALAAGVPGREGPWAGEVDTALAELEAALRQHVAGAEASDGLLSGVDLKRPSYVRRVSELRRQHEDFVRQIWDFRRDVAEAAATFRRTIPRPTAPSVGLPEPAGPGAVPDFGALRQRGGRLTAALRQHRDAETGLTLDSVTTDIGAGD